MQSEIQPDDDESFFVLDEDGRTPVLTCGYIDWPDQTPGRIIRERVARTRFDGCWVSTIFWGIPDHGPDKLFETMVFKGDPRKRASYKRELAVWRCATWDEAERQHEEACAWLRAEIEALKAWDTIP